MIARYALPLITCALALAGLSAVETPTAAEPAPVVLVISNTALAALVLALWHKRRRHHSPAAAPTQWACRCPHCGEIHMHNAHDARPRKQEPPC